MPWIVTEYGLLKLEAVDAFQIEDDSRIVAILRSGQKVLVGKYRTDVEASNALNGLEYSAALGTLNFSPRDYDFHD